jgi:hypothetical protein
VPWIVLLKRARGALWAIRLHTAQASKCTGNSTAGNVSGGAVEARPSTVQLPIVQASNCLLRVRLIAGFSPLGRISAVPSAGEWLGRWGNNLGGDPASLVMTKAGLTNKGNLI